MTEWFDAAKNGDAKRLAELLRNGVAVDAAYAGGMTALMHAAGYGRTEAARLLLSVGADVRAVGKVPVHTPIICAVHYARIDASGDMELHSHGSKELVALLLAAGADVRAKDGRDNSLLHYAAIYNRADLIPVLIQAGVEIDGQNITGHTALIIAAGHGYTDVVKSLLEAGADVTCVLKINGQNAMTRAARRGQQEIVELLERAANQKVRFVRENGNETSESRGGSLEFRAGRDR